MGKQREPDVNPPQQVVRHDPPEVVKAKAFAYHRRAGSMETYYDCYPDDRPPGRGSRDSGRSR